MNSKKTIRALRTASFISLVLAVFIVFIYPYILNNKIDPESSVISITVDEGLLKTIGELEDNTVEVREYLGLDPLEIEYEENQEGPTDDFLEWEGTEIDDNLIPQNEDL